MDADPGSDAGADRQPPPSDDMDQWFHTVRDGAFLYEGTEESWRWSFQFD